MTYIQVTDIRDTAPPNTGHMKYSFKFNGQLYHARAVYDPLRRAIVAGGCQLYFDQTLGLIWLPNSIPRCPITYRED